MFSCLASLSYLPTFTFLLCPVFNHFTYIYAITSVELIYSCWCSLGFRCHVVSQVDANISEKQSVSIFRTEMTRQGSSGSMYDLRSKGWGKGDNQREGIFYLISPLFPSLVTSALKTEIVHFSEMLVSTYKTTWHQNPRLHHHNNNHCEILKSHVHFHVCNTNVCPQRLSESIHHSHYWTGFVSRTTRCQVQTWS
jgi:hypothetical protein